jgi:Dual specificity phosphatase, catalytic domain
VKLPWSKSRNGPAASPVARGKRSRVATAVWAGFFGLLVLAVGGVWFYLVNLEQSYLDKGANYSLIEDRLYAGGAVKKPPRGTRAVLNLCEQDDPYRAEVHVWDSIRDRAPAPDLDWLRQKVEFIDAQRKAGKTTFVHCRNGVSRSGMVVTAYVMWEHHLSLNEALTFVRKQRDIIRPNRAFMERLSEWEEAQKEQPPADGEGR